ncbi:MAG: 3,4-dihydroxy-2-butanone-4-phosphate synthase, partial [Candidatus Acidiferrales bacterium]
MATKSALFATVEEAIEEIRQGRMIIIVDDEDRENEGDLTVAAEKITPEQINFMAKHGRGLVCVSLTTERCDHLRLRSMTDDNTSPYGTAFCESIDAGRGISTGISAADRAATIRTAIDPATRPGDLVRPGHMFPLRARKGGVLVRAGQTEASVDLARLADLTPAGVICEVMNDDGSMARVPELSAFCRQHSLKMVTVADLIRYRLRTEQYVHRRGESLLPTRYGDFHMIAYESELDGEKHVALVKGNFSAEDAVLVRVHSHCLAGDVFGSTRCACRALVDKSLEIIARAGRGVFLYLHQTRPGFGIKKVDDKNVL